MIEWYATFGSDRERPMQVATAAQTRRLEQEAIDRGATWPGLMAQAGQGIAKVALECLPQVRGARVLVLVGPGNNGGDGLVVARHLHDAGARVTVYVWRRTMRLDDWPRVDTLARGIPEVDASADSDRTIVKMLATEAVLVVDALLGIGLTRPLDEDICGIV